MSDAAGRYERLHAVFESARLLGGEERERLLEERCGADRALRREVEELLAALEGDAPYAFSEGGISAARGALEELLEPRAAPDGAGAPGWLPERVGRFRIVRRLGEGGMGVVYEALQESPRRRVAVKLLHPRSATDERRRRFRQEAELLGRLHHPGIAQIHEAGTHDFGGGPQPFIAMEFVEGRDLATHAAEVRLPARARLELLARVCDAVQHAHEQGVIHRDLKPDNVLVDARGTPKVLDFGVARAAEGSTVLTTMVTEEGDLLGTIAYMAPEQLEGLPDLITPRADVYALGAIAFELLAGRPPHDLVGLPLATAMQIARDKEPTRLGDLRPELRGDVETIVGKALEKEPERRYASAAALARDLRAHLEHRPIAARPPSRVYRALKFTRRNKALVWGSAATLVALAAGALVSLLFALRSSRNAGLAREGERRAQAGLLQATQDLLERGDLSRAAFTFRPVSGTTGWEVDLLARALPNMLPERYGVHDSMWIDDERLAVMMPDGLVVLAVDGWRELGHHLEGRIVAAPSRERPVFRLDWTDEAVALDLDTGEVLRRFALGERDRAVVDAQGHVRSIRFDEDAGAWCAFLDDARVAALEPAAGAEFAVFPSPDGRRVVAIDKRAGRARVHDTGTGALLGELDGLRRSSCARVIFPADGREFLTFDEDLFLVEVDTERVEVLARHWINAVTGCAAGDVSADGRLFATDADSEGRFDVIDLTTDAVVFSDRLDLFAGSASVQLSPDGRRVLLEGQEIGSCVVDLEERLVRSDDLGTERDPRSTTYSEHGGYVQDFALSPDGRLVASVSPPDAALRIWDADTGETVTTVAKPRGARWEGYGDRGYLIAFAPDGRRLLATVGDAEGGRPPLLLVHDLTTGASRLEELAPELSRASHLPWLDRFVEVLDATGPLRISGKAVLTADGAVLAVQALTGRVTAGERWRFFVDRNEEHGLSPSPDGARVAVAAQRTVRVYERRTGRELAAFPGQARSSAWSPDGRLIAIGAHDGRIRLIDAELSTELYGFRAHEGEVLAVAWTPDGTRLVSCGEDGRLRVWDPRGQAERAADRAAYDARVERLRALDDERLLARLDAAGSAAARFAALRVLLERREELTAAAEPGSRAASWTQESGTSAAPPDARLLGFERVTTFAEHTSYVYTLAVSPDGGTVASMAVEDPLLRLWDAATGRPLGAIEKGAGTVGRYDWNGDQLLAFSADGRRLVATASASSTPRLLVCDLLTGAVREQTELGRPLSRSHAWWLDRALEELGGAPPRRLGRTACTTPDGRAVASTLPLRVDTPAWVRWTPLDGAAKGEGAALSPDGRRVVLAGADGLRLVDRASGRALASAPGQAYGVAWSPDGSRIAAGGVDGRIRLHAADLRELGGFRAHDGYVFSLAWTPDGARLVSCSGDGTVRVWDGRSEEERERDRRARDELRAELTDLSAVELGVRFATAATAAERGAVIRAALELRR